MCSFKSWNMARSDQRQFEFPTIPTGTLRLSVKKDNVVVKSVGVCFEASAPSLIETNKASQLIAQRLNLSEFDGQMLGAIA
ncbi:MAG: hypothetical protein AAF152_02285 [Cyanobacteria bacterium P01_A01_bin.114]